MGSSKLKVIHVLIIAVVVSVILVVVTYVMSIQKTNAAIVVAQQQYVAAKAIADQRPKAEADMIAAKASYAMVVAQYEKLLNEKMPPLTFENRLGGWLSLLHELGDVLGPKVTAWPQKTGVKLTSAIQIPAGPNDANLVNTDVIVLNLGALSVTGSFAQIMSHIRSWNRFDRLVQVDPVSLTGYSPNMTGQYNLTVYIFPRGSAGPPIAMASGGGAPVAGAPVGPSAGPGGGAVAALPHNPALGGPGGPRGPRGPRGGGGSPRGGAGAPAGRNDR